MTKLIKFNSLKLSKVYFQTGFTLIELSVVLVILAVLISLVVANIGGQRANRNLKLAQNQLVTNLRKAQSYSLFSRNLGSRTPVQIYVVKFDLQKPREYSLIAVYDISTAPKITEVEKFYLPEGVRLSLADPLLIDRAGSFTDQVPVYPTGCVLIGFKAPFAKIVANNGCVFLNFGGDDYESLKNFVYNEETNSASSDSIVTIKLGDISGSLSKTVTINGINGAIIFEQ